MKVEQKQYALANTQEYALQNKYVGEIIKRSPGLGEKSKGIAADLVKSGLSPNEALALIQVVYNPTDLDGRGQGTRLKWFSEAVQRRYGDVVLHNASQNITSFRRLLGNIGDAVEMRDEINAEIGPRQTFTFDDVLVFQEMGLTTESLCAHYDNLVSQYGFSPIAAVMRIKESVRRMDCDRTIMTLENLLYPSEMDKFVNEVVSSEANEDLVSEED